MHFQTVVFLLDFRKFVSTITRYFAILLALLTAGCCAHKRASVSVVTLAEAHAKRLALPLNSVHAEFRKKVKDRSVEKDVDLILASTAEVHYVVDGKLVATRLGDSPTGFVEDARKSFKQRGFVEPSDLLLDVTWDFCGMTPIHTIAVTDKKGNPKFEPVLYFGFSIETPISSNPKQSPEDPTFQWELTNGFGIKCVKASWDIQPPKFQGCQNPDPPRLSYIFGRACEPPRCWLWTAVCTQGENRYSRSHESCSPKGLEDCVEIGMRLGVAFGTSTVRLEGIPREWNKILYQDGDILKMEGVFGHSFDFYEKKSFCARD